MLVNLRGLRAKTKRKGNWKATSTVAQHGGGPLMKGPYWRTYRKEAFYKLDTLEGFPFDQTWYVATSAGWSSWSHTNYLGQLRFYWQNYTYQIICCHRFPNLVTGYNNATKPALKIRNLFSLSMVLQNCVCEKWSNDVISRDFFTRLPANVTQPVILWPLIQIEGFQNKLVTPGVLPAT